jgi:hypothetical protein
VKLSLYAGDSAKLTLKYKATAFTTVSVNVTVGGTADSANRSGHAMTSDVADSARRSGSAVHADTADFTPYLNTGALWTRLAAYTMPVSGGYDTLKLDHLYYDDFNEYDSAGGSRCFTAVRQGRLRVDVYWTPDTTKGATLNTLILRNADTMTAHTITVPSASAPPMAVVWSEFEMIPGQHVTILIRASYTLGYKLLPARKNLLASYKWLR